MTDELHPPPDVPPVPSPGGPSAADDLLARARGKASGSRTTRGRVPRAEPGASAEPEPKPAADTRVLKVVREGVLEIYTAAEMLCTIADPPTAQLIGHNKERCADAWIELAKQDPRVLRLLRKLTTGAGWGAVVMAHMPIVLPVLMRRGILPGGALFGGAPFNAMGGQPEGPAPWPHGVEESLFNGHVTFGQNGNA